MCAVPSQWHSHGQACGSPQVDIHCIKFFHRSRFLSNLRLPWKNRVALKFFTVLNILFIIQDFWATCACPENRVCSGMFHCRLLNMYFLAFRIIEQLALALKNRVALEIWNCIVCIFTIQDFWATLRLPGNFSLCWIYFYIQEFSSTCPEKQRVPWIQCTEHVFFIQGF